MTSRHAGVAMIFFGLLVAAWAWFGAWPFASPVYGEAPDYTGLHGLSFALAIFAVSTSIVGVFLATAGRGGPEDWRRR